MSIAFFAPTKFWTDRRVAELTELWDSGAKSSRCAKSLGCTRFAVLSKVSRLRLSARRTRKPPSITCDVKISIPGIKDAVCKFYGVTRPEMNSRMRDRMYNEPRQVAMYLSREMTTGSLPYIGRQFDRHHATVILAIRSVANSPERKAEADQIRVTMEGWAAVFGPTDFASQVRQQKEACEAVAVFIRSLNINICNCHYCVARAKGLA